MLIILIDNDKPLFFLHNMNFLVNFMFLHWLFQSPIYWLGSNENLQHYPKRHWCNRRSKKGDKKRTKSDQEALQVSLTCNRLTPHLVWWSTILAQFINTCTGLSLVYTCLVYEIKTSLCLQRIAERQTRLPARWCKRHPETQMVWRVQFWWFKETNAKTTHSS